MQTGESRKVRSMWDELEERKGKEEEEEPAEEKIEGGGDSTRKTGEDDSIKENLVLLNSVDRIYIPKNEILAITNETRPFFTFYNAYSYQSFFPSCSNPMVTGDIRVLQWY